ncbi:hypothetical protein MES5069_650039 [Mesorhizobium escarrei]|uniref:Uncharacterized protein n=1 Tax=Mesorhizobium escarrei TaxID=666018 RepID=A0ABN8KCW5_9HYPH|nr:hypothetical protein MES5069_650039 [Mesorhizobium escarrei]
MRVSQRTARHDHVCSFSPDVANSVDEINVERDLRIPGKEFGNEWQKNMRAYWSGGTNRQAARRCFAGRGAAFGLADIGQDPDTAFVKNASFRRKMERSGGAIE